MTCASSLARRTAGLSVLDEEFWGCCADDVGALRPDSNVSVKAKSSFYIAPLLFLIKIVPPVQVVSGRNGSRFFLWRRSLLKITPLAGICLMDYSDIGYSHYESANDGPESADRLRGA